MKLQHWLKGLIGAVIGGAANAITLAIVDPQNFNIHEGAGKLYNVAIVSAIVSVAMYLKQSPVPPDEDVKVKALPLILALLIPCLLIGCATAPSGNATVGGYELTPERIQTNIQIVAKVGAREGCKQDKNVEAYLQAAVVVLSAALDKGQYDIDTLKASLAAISVKEIRSDSAQQYISDALELYQNNAADVVSGKLDGVKYLRPALTGLRDGIVEGLAQYDATKGN